MTEAFPMPLVPFEVDLRDFPFTPLFRSRLFGSSFHARATDSEWRAGVTLWLKSWDQVPAGSLPDDDIDLCRLAELGRDLKTWAKVKAGAMRGWFRCNDGRLHHQVVAEGVLEAWSKRRISPKQGTAGAAAKWGVARDQANKMKRHERLAEARLKGTHTPDEWKALLEFCDNVCVICNVATAEVKDHITPIYQGGSDAIDNLQPTCRSCNSAKGADRTDHRPEGWLQHVSLQAPQTSAQTPAQTPAPRITSAQTPAKCLLTPGNRQGQGEGREKETSLRDAKKAELVARKRQVPAEWEPNEQGRRYAKLRGLQPSEVDAFRNFHISKGTTFANIDRAWMTWCDKAVEFGRGRLPLAERAAGVSV